MANKKSEMIKIQLVKSPIGYAKNQKDTLTALGLRKMNAVVEKEDNDCIRGMVRKVKHLVKVL